VRLVRRPRAKKLLIPKGCCGSTGTARKESKVFLVLFFQKQNRFTFLQIAFPYVYER
jgi:hypothetical protein